MAEITVPRTRRRLLLVLLAFVLIVSVGTLGLQLLEGWGWSDSLWMVFMTLTTIGFSEVHPLSQGGRVFTICLFLSGLSLGTYLLTQLTRLVVEGELTRAFVDRYRRHRMLKLRDHFIVVGYGRLGRAIAQELRDERAKYCVVESQRERTEGLSEKLGVPVLVGDATSEETLHLAGVERARGIAISLPAPADAVYVTLTARQMNPELLILTRCEDPHAQAKARRAGANSVVSPSHMGGWRMAQGLVRPNVSHLLDMATLSADDQIRFDELVVSPTSPLLNKPIRELPIGSTRGLLIVGIRRKGGGLVTAPSGDETIKSEDVLIAIGTPEAVKNLRTIMD